MLQVKQELLAALSQALDGLLPGSGNKAAFESPKVAAHGDFAITAAMQLAKPLKLNPRQLGEQLRDALLAAPVYQQWVQDIEIAGPGFINIRLKPAARQQVVAAARAARHWLKAVRCWGQRSFPGAGWCAQRAHTGASHVPLFLVGTFQSHRRVAGRPQPQRWRVRDEQTMAEPPPGKETWSHVMIAPRPMRRARRPPGCWAGSA